LITFTVRDLSSEFYSLNKKSAESSWLNRPNNKKYNKILKLKLKQAIRAEVEKAPQNPVGGFECGLTKNWVHNLICFIRCLLSNAQACDRCPMMRSGHFSRYAAAAKTVDHDPDRRFPLLIRTVSVSTVCQIRQQGRRSRENVGAA
jgi:hypothetical protein